MSIKRKLLATAATLTIAGGVSAAATLPASAATPQCSATGQTCVDIFSAKFGTPASPGFVETVFLGIPLPGVPTLLHQASSSNPAEDLVVAKIGRVSAFYTDHLVSAAVNAQYGSETAVQVEYAPDGKDTGLCAGLATTAFQDEGLSLQPCGTPGTTVWILDAADSPGTAYVPLVNGSNTDFVHPLGMTILGDPAQEVFPQIIVQHLSGNPGNVPANQLWGFDFGIVP